MDAHSAAATGGEVMMVDGDKSDDSVRGRRGDPLAANRAATTLSPLSFSFKLYTAEFPLKTQSLHPLKFSYANPDKDAMDKRIQ